MDIYITFFARRNDDTDLNVANGFSFGREKKPDDVDLYFLQGRDPSFIAAYLKRYPSVDHIFCSLGYAPHLKSIAPLIDERWVLGGPFVAGMLSRGAQVPGTAYPGSFESYLGKQELSSTFDSYFANLVKTVKLPQLFFNCSLGKGCYWSRCKFCDYRHYDSKGEQTGKVVLRPNVRQIIEQLRPLEGSRTWNAHLCIPSIPPKALAEVLDAHRDRRVILTVFMRADHAILNVLRDRPDPTVCESILFSIGCESLSQTALDLLNKGTTVDNTLELVRLILKRGGMVALGIMDHYVFLTRKMVAEYLDALERLKAIVKDYPKSRVKFTNNGVTHWPSEAAVAEFTDDYTAVDCGGYKRYVANLPEDSEAFQCNKDVSLALQNSGMQQRGFPFASLSAHGSSTVPSATSPSNRYFKT